MCLLFVALGLSYGTLQQFKLASLHARATGIVIGFVVSDGGDGTSTSSLIQFMTERQQLISFQASADPPPHHTGQNVLVAYDPAQPGRAMLDSFWDIWLTPLLVASWGVAVLSMLVAGLISRSRRRAVP